MKLDALSNAPWGEPVLFHSPSPDYLTVTFQNDAEEITMDGRKIQVHVDPPTEDPNGIVPPIVYEVSKLKYFMEYAVRTRRAKHPTIKTLPSDKEMAEYWHITMRQALRMFFAADPHDLGLSS